MKLFVLLCLLTLTGCANHIRMANDSAIGFPLRLATESGGAGGPGDDGGGENSLVSIQAKVNSLTPIGTVRFTSPTDTQGLQNIVMVSLNGGPYVNAPFTAGTTDTFNFRTGLAYKFIHTQPLNVGSGTQINVILNVTAAAVISRLSTWNVTITATNFHTGSFSRVKNFGNNLGDTPIFTPELNSTVIAPQVFNASSFADMGQTLAIGAYNIPNQMIGGNQTASNFEYDTNIILIP